MICLAIKLVAENFHDKVDKAGEPYILHCLRVMNGVDQSDKELMQIAVLHDIVEDTEVTLQHLFDLGFSIRVIDGVSALTHNKDISYQDYIEQMVDNKDAVAVKLVDLRDNMSITRLEHLTQKDIDRVVKYHEAYTFLKGLRK